MYFLTPSWWLALVLHDNLLDERPWYDWILLGCFKVARIVDKNFGHDTYGVN